MEVNLGLRVVVGNSGNHSMPIYADNPKIRTIYVVARLEDRLAKEVAWIER